MRAIFVVGLLLLLFGCLETKDLKTVGEAIQNFSASLDERTFVYDIGNRPTGPVKRTIAELDVPSPDAYTIYGRTNLTVRECVIMEEGYNKARCLWNAAIYLNDSSICERAGEDYIRGCYYRYAIGAENASACDLSGSGPVVKQCRRMVAVYTGNASLCGYDNTEIQGKETAERCKTFAASGKLVGKKECKDEIVPMVLVESPYFADSIGWLAKNHPGEKVLSWWDYGTPMDCMGLKSVVSNKNLDDPNILETAHIFIAGNESELASFMKANGVRYLMIDSELISGGNSLGGKYGALNYLSCVQNGETDIEANIGDSECESDHLWESVVISNLQCDISKNKTGYLAYKIYQKITDIERYTHYYPYTCINPTKEEYKEFCNSSVTVEPVYCIGETKLADGSTVFVPYHLNETNPDNSLKLNRAFLELPVQINSTYHFGDAVSVTFFYTSDKIWLENDSISDGYQDRTTAFYDSVIYKAFFLNSLEGFEKGYEDPSGSVKIFELKE